MPQLEEIVHYLRGVWLLALGKSEGEAYLNLTVDGVLRSFMAILWCLPAMAVSWAAWRFFYLENMPQGTVAGVSFILRLGLIDLVAWIVPLMVISALARPLGYGQHLAAIIVSTNWLSVPVFYAMAIPAALRLVIPGAGGLAGLLSLLALVAGITAIFRVVRSVTANQTLLATALTGLFILPSLMIGETLQSWLGLLPG